MPLYQTAQGSTNTSTITLTFANNIARGHGVVVCVTGIAATSGGGLSVTPGSGGDTYSQQVHDTGTNGQSSIWAVFSSAGGYTTITVKNTTTAHGYAAWAYETDTITALDQSSTNFNNGGFNSSWTSSATSTTGQASEFWAGVANGEFTNSQTITGPSSPWVNESSQTPQDVGVWFYPSLSGYQIPGATGAATYNGTFSVGANAWSACVAAFKTTPGGLLPALFP